MLQTQIFIQREYFFKAGLKRKEEKAECLRSKSREFQRAAETMATPVVRNLLQHSLPPWLWDQSPREICGL